MNESKRIWLVTDVPFWKMANGSHLRIAELSRAIVEQGHQISLWFVGEADRDALERILPAQGWSEIRGPLSPPDGFIQRMQWRLAGTINAVKVAGNSRATHRQPMPQSKLTSSRELSDFSVAPIRRRFLSDVKVAQPDAIIFQYLTMTHLASGILGSKWNRRPLLVLDTHDVMHKRHREFTKQGLKHWLAIDQAEETNALRNFDVVMAIQNDEQAIFQEMLPGHKVITAGYSIEPLSDDTRPSTSLNQNRLAAEQGPVVTIGYLGGRGAANRAGLMEFLSGCWPKIVEQFSDSVQLRIAGHICQDLSQAEMPERVRLDGAQADLEHWYRGIEIVVNPIQAGAGLKIKNIEALSFGKCLVTTRLGMQGMHKAEREAGVAVAADIPAMFQPLANRIDDRSLRTAAQNRAISYIRDNHQRSVVFRELWQVLNC